MAAGRCRRRWRAGRSAARSCSACRRSRSTAWADGVDGALGRLLAIVAAAQADGTWERLKACPWDTCRWAFYDHSRNRSGVWCSMAVCGNRAKVQAFRARQERSRPSLPST